jgi:golgin subfamily B member 1
MADYQQHLTTLEGDPQNQQALSALARLAAAGGDKGGLTQPSAAQALEEARRVQRERGEIELVARLFDVELAAVADRERRADLFLEKGRFLFEELYDENEAVECFQRVLELRPEDSAAAEQLSQMEMIRQNWERIVKKYVEEARVSTDRQLATGLYLSVAEGYARYRVGPIESTPEVEMYLRKALEVEPRNKRAARMLEQVLRRSERWDELAGLVEQRIDAAGTKEERIQALLAQAELARGPLGKPQLASDAMKKILAVDPAHPRALQVLIDGYMAEENWSALVKVYESALKARGPKSGPGEELGLYLQIAMTLWKRLGQLDAAEEYFRRIRKIDAAHPAMVDFYRAYHQDRKEGHKLLQVLQQAQKTEQDPGRRATLGKEVASLAETEGGNPEKAIDSWKAILRQNPKNPEARDAIRRLYQKTEKWNALLEILKEDVEQIPSTDEAGKAARAEKLLEIVAIYRDKLNLDVMVINTYNTILQLVPGHSAALDALAGKYEHLGRWNDLITILGRKADALGSPEDRPQKVALLRRIAGLWMERFANHAQAVKPLEELVLLEPRDSEAIGKLKEIYGKRRQWRALLDLLGREADTLDAAGKRQQLVEMARLASDKLGDVRASIGVWNKLLEVDDKDTEALSALAALYERERRWLSLAEILHRQREAASADPRAAVTLLERLGALYAEKLEGPAQGAAAYREVLELAPGHQKAIRVLRELYAQAGDFGALEEMYGKLNAWDELIEVLHGLVDRSPQPEQKLALLSRIAQLATDRLKAPEKATKAHERMLALDPQNAAAAKSLLPIYRKAEKWPRLLATYEVVLGHTKDRGEQLALLQEIRKLCEEKIGSKMMAFQWCARAYELSPDDPALLRDLERLGAEADAWEQVADILSRRVALETVSNEERLRLLRELGRIKNVRLHKIDDSRAAWEQVLRLAPDDAEAMTALEELAAQQARWPDLLVIYRRRAELEKDADKRLEMLFKIAFIEEERVGNLDGAAETYERILQQEPKSQRAIRALVKVQGARKDGAGLARALERELELATENELRVNLLLRLGGLYEADPKTRTQALDRYLRALQLSTTNKAVHEALERFLAPDSAERVEVARKLAPVYERADAAGKLAEVLEILREAEADDAARLGIDRRLVALYGKRLADPLAGYEAATRVLFAAPEDLENRAVMTNLAQELTAFDDLAQQLGRVLEKPPASLSSQKLADLWADLAEITDEKLDDKAGAEKAWRKVLELDATNDAAYGSLERLLRDAERWPDLKEVLDRRAQATLDDGKRREVLLQICDLYEGVLDDAAGATTAYQRVLELDPTSLRAYKALERLYEQGGRWKELEDLLGREVQVVTAEAELVSLLSRRAQVRAHHLKDSAGAVDIAEEALGRAPQHAPTRQLLEELFPKADLRLRIARLLGPLYEADGNWAAQIKMIHGEREFSVSKLEAVEHLARIATIQEERLGDVESAFQTWRDAVLTDPEDNRGRIALERLARTLDRWEEAALAWEDAVQNVPPGETATRSTLLGEVAAIYDRCLGDAQSATNAYRRLLDLHAGAALPDLEAARPAAAALERLYDEQEAWAPLIEILRKQAEWAESPERRIEHLVRAASIQEARLRDPAAAIGTWREVLHEDPESKKALDALERLHASRGESRELVDVLRRRVELGRTPQEKRDHLTRIARLQEEQLGHAQESILAYLEILDHLPDDRGTMTELARLYRAQSRWADLLDVDERRLAGADTAERAALRMELGELLQSKLGRAEEALERFRQVLHEDAAHETALAAVEKFLADPQLKLRAAEILKPIYDGAGDHEKLVGLYELEAAADTDPRDKLGNLRKVAELRERHLGDPDGAYHAIARACRVALAEPELPDLLATAERLALSRNRVPDLVTLYRELAPDVLDGELQRRLYLDIAELAAEELRDLPLAREYYRRVLDAHQDDRRALNALEQLYRQTEEHGELREILARKAELVGDDLDARRDALAEIARLAEEKLGRNQEAVAAWEQVLEMMPADLDATRALERLYAQGERWVELAELLERRMGYAEDLAEAVDLRYRLGELYDKRLSDPDKAVENYSAALGGDGQHAQAIGALERFLEDAGTRLGVAEVLEPIYIGRQDWQALIRITEIRLDATHDPASRLALTRRIARLYEEQLEDLEGAFRWYGKVFREDPEDATIRDQLVRLSTILERWDGLANVYQGFLDDETGDRPAVLEVARSLGEIYDRRLNEVELARAAYRRVLHAAPDDMQTFTKLEAMLGRAARWFALIETYEEALEASFDPLRRRELLAKTAQVQELRLGAVDKSIEAYRSILELGIEEPTAWTDEDIAASSLDRLYQDQKRWSDLAELLLRRIERLGHDVNASNALRLRLADVQETRLDDTAGAIDQYEKVLDQADVDVTALQSLERLIVDNGRRYRIAQILEPIYRRHDWWQKLVVILDAQLEFVDDKGERVKMLQEIARLHEERAGSMNLAFDAQARAWKEDVADEAVYGELERIATKLEKWEELCQTLDAGVEGVYDYDLAARLLSRIGEIEEHKRQDRIRAIAAWKRVLEVKEDDAPALDALERLHAAENDPPALVKVLERKVELADDPDKRKDLYARIATLYERDLAMRDQAIAAWRQVESLGERDPAALDALERLYRQARDFRALVEVLGAKIDLALDAETQKPLRYTAAAVYDNELKDTFEAISQYKAVLELDDGDAHALEQLDKLFEREKSWADLVEIVDKRAEIEFDMAKRAELRYRAARVVEKELREAGQAIDRYRLILMESPKHQATREALDALTREEDTLQAAADVLEPIYAADGLADRVAELYERRLASRSADPTQRRDRVAALATVHEQGRKDPISAFVVWSRFLREEPEDAGAQGELERITAERGRWAELAGLYESILENTMDAELGRFYALKLASIYEEALGDLEQAAGRHRKALELGGEEPGSLGALDRIYERQGKSAELAEVLAREALVANSDDEQAVFLYRLGDVREQALGDIRAAVDAYRSVLERIPAHPAARAALERLLGNPAERPAVIEILEPLYEQDGDWARLVDLYEHKLSIESSPIDRASLLQRAAELAEQRLGDKMRALDAVGRWLAEDPTSLEAMGELERLAGELGRWEEAAARLSDVTTPVADSQRELVLRRGRILLEELGDPLRAEEAYLKVLELDRQNGAALAALDQIYRATGDHGKLVGVLWRRAEAEFDASAKRDFYAEVGRLREEKLGDAPGAVTAWKQVLDLEEGDSEGLGRLVGLYEQAEAWEELVNVLDAQARFAGDPQLEVACRRAAAQVLGDKLGSLDRAVDAWSQVAELAPEDDAALVALADIHRRREDWLAVQETLVRRLSLAANAGARVEILKKLASLAENERQSPDEAIGYLYQVLDESPTERDGFAALERILTASDRAHDLIELYERRAKVHADAGDTAGEIAYLARAADVWEEKLGNADAAAEILERLLERDPTFVAALTRLARIYEAAGDWEKCGQALQRALAMNPKGRDAADLYYRLGRVTEAQTGDPGQAVEHYQKALSYDGGHPQVLEALEKIARDAGDWETVAAIAVRREEAETDPQKKLGLALALADLYRTKLGRAAEAVPYLERAAAMSPDDATVTETLADLYFAAGRGNDAEPLYRKLAEKAKTARKTKDIAKYQQRLAGLREAAGDLPEALKAYEETYRVDPSNGATMAGLGRIYFGQEDWEKARRIYRSMLLQNLDPSVGVSKADVYLQLGLIHARLNEGPKAKGMYERGLELEPGHAGLRAAIAELK